MSCNTILPFMLNESQIRGRIIKTDSVIDQILSNHNYPEPIAGLLGEFALVAAIIGSMMKAGEIITVQLKTDKVIKLMVIDFFDGYKVRGYCNWDEEKLSALLNEKKPINFNSLAGEGIMAITVDKGADMEKYQGIVSLEGDSLTKCLEDYFTLSEQVPTTLKLAIGQVLTGNKMKWCGGGIIIQQIPLSASMQLDDYQENWNRNKCFIQSIKDDELLDPEIQSEQLLYRLFHEEGVWVYSPEKVEASCRCSRVKAENILNSIPVDQLEELKIDGKISVKCEFCNSEEVFTDL